MVTPATEPVRVLLVEGDEDDPEIVALGSPI
jgi:hypothetical protein